MSLINDALKRASQSDKSNQREPTLSELMQPVRRPRRKPFPVGIVVCVVLLLATSGWLIYRYFAPGTTVHPHTAVTPAVPAPAPKVEPPPIAAPVPAPVIVSAHAAKTNPPPPFPELKLQGIFFTRVDPKVILNGQTCGENEKIGEVRVVKIYANKVTLEWQRQTKDLRMENQ
jgi:hypothetical protein